MYEEEYTEPDFLKRKEKNPFRTPEGYFDSIEDRIMKRIELPEKSKPKTTRIIKFMKPALGLAASLLLAALLVYSPMKTLLLKNDVKVAMEQIPDADLLDEYSLNLASIDDNTLAYAIFSDESIATTLNADEVLAYLSTNLNDVEIYSEIQN